MTRRSGFIALVAAAYVLCPMSDVRSQDTKIRAQREELTRIRLERSNLEKQMLELRSTAHDLSEEVGNLDRRADATSRLVRVLDRQLGSIAEEVNDATANMGRAESEL